MCASSIQIDKIIFKKCKHHSLKKTFPDDVLLTPNSSPFPLGFRSTQCINYIIATYHINYDSFFFSPQFSPTKSRKLPGLPSLFSVLTYEYDTEYASKTCMLDNL